MRKRTLLLGAAGVAAAAIVRHNVRGRRNLHIAALGVQVGGTYASTAARKMFASAERRLELDDERELRTAEAIADRLGNMKGALMKLGQMASYVDEGLPAPMRAGARRTAVERAADERRPRRRSHRARARPPPTRCSSSGIPSRSPRPASARYIAPLSSIPTTGLERAVAVKVQYPGVGAAIEADLRNASLIGAILKQGFGGLDPDDMVAEIRERLIDELDYSLEAENQQAFADFYRGHPFIRVPEVIASHSTGSRADQRARRWRDLARDGPMAPGGARPGRGMPVPIRVPQPVRHAPVQR